MMPETADICIREAKASDGTTIARVQARTMVASAYYDTSHDEDAEYGRLFPRITSYLAGTYHPSYALVDRAMFVATYQQQPIGFIAGHRSTRMGCTAELQWMFVVPEWQRQGVGGRLLHAMIPWFHSHASTRVIVDAAPENPYRAFYLKHGAIPLDAYWLYWEDITQVMATGIG